MPSFAPAIDWRTYHADLLLVGAEGEKRRVPVPPIFKLRTAPSPIENWTMPVCLLLK